MTVNGSYILSIRLVYVALMLFRKPKAYVNCKLNSRYMKNKLSTNDSFKVHYVLCWEYR